MLLVKKKRLLLASYLVVMMSIMLTACGSDMSKLALEPAHLVLVIGCHEGSPGVKADILLSAVQPLCSQEGSTIEVIALDGMPYKVPDSKCTVLGLNDYTKAQQERFANSNAQSVVDYSLEHAIAKSPETNPLMALQQAARIVNAYGNDGLRKQILIADSGLSTVSPLDMSETGLNIDVETTVSALEAQRAIPDLTGVEVTCCYFGDTTPNQATLTGKDREVLKTVWTRILEKANAHYVFSQVVPSSEQRRSGDLPPVKKVPSGETTNAIRLAQKEVIELSEADLGFLPDSTELKNEQKAKLALSVIASEIREGNLSIVIAGSTATVASATEEECRMFSKQRADKVAQLLESQGVSHSQIQTFGLGYSTHSRRVNDRNGSKDAMDKNRVVYIATKESDFAKEVQNIAVTS